MRRLSTTLVALMLLVVGCGGDGDSEAVTTTTAAATTTQAATTTAATTTTATVAATTATAQPETTPTPTMVPTTTTTVVLAAFDPLEVTFQSDWKASNAANSFTGRFAASGPAVDAGIMCREGQHWTNSNELTGTGLNTRIEEGFRCDDGSGGFTIIETVTRRSPQDDNPEMVDIFGDWTLTDGSGVFEGMSGEGTFTGTFDTALTGNGTEEETGQIWRDE